MAEEKKRRQIRVDNDAYNRLQEFKQNNGGSIKGVASEAIRRHLTREGNINQEK